MADGYLADFMGRNAYTLSRKLWYYLPVMKHVAQELGIESMEVAEGDESSAKREVERLLILMSGKENLTDGWQSFQTHVSNQDMIAINFLMTRDIVNKIPSHVDACYVVKSVYDRGEETQLAFGTDFYKMTSKPRGYFVIINNRNFTGSNGELVEDRERTHTEKDVDKMVAVALGLGFVPRVRTDLTKNQTEDYLDMIAKDRSLEAHDAFVLMVMSHGYDDAIESTDRQLIKFERIRNGFESSVCPALDNKPKIFIFVCCRGEKMDGPGLGPEYGTDPTTSFAKGDGVPVIDDSPPRRVNHTIAIFSTVPGFVSWRRPWDGSHFVEIFAKTLAEFACRESLQQMLSRVTSSHEVLPIDPSARKPTFQTPEL